jgi:hypothetical protein
MQDGNIRDLYNRKECFKSLYALPWEIVLYIDLFHSETDGNAKHYFSHERVWKRLHGAILLEKLRMALLLKQFLAIYIYLSMALQPFVGPWPLFSFLIYTQSVRLLGRVISPSQGRYLNTEQHKHRINAHRYPSLERDSNPRPQRSNGRRQFMP